MATAAQTIFDRFKYAMKDEASVRWTRPEFTEWLNAAQVEAVKLVPEINSEIVSVSLVAGVRQSLGATGLLLLDVFQNTGGNAITEVDQQVMAVSLPSWTGLTQQSNVRHFIKDVKEKRDFYVYPPNDGNGSVEVLQASYPTEITDVTSENISLADEYADAILDYCLYRAHSKDDEAAETGKAAQFLKAFTAKLGVNEG